MNYKLISISSIALVSLFFFFKNEEETPSKKIQAKQNNINIEKNITVHIYIPTSSKLTLKEEIIKVIVKEEESPIKKEYLLSNKDLKEIALNDIYHYNNLDNDIAEEEIGILFKAEANFIFRILRLKQIIKKELLNLDYESEKYSKLKRQLERLDFIYDELLEYSIVDTNIDDFFEHFNQMMDTQI